MIHDYLPAVGFDGLRDNQRIYKLLEKIVLDPDEHKVVEDTHGNRFGCFVKEFGKNMGLTVCGNFYNQTEFHIDYYFPYLRGSQVSLYPAIDVEKYMHCEGYAGICDETELGLTLIFQINNMTDILRARKSCCGSFMASSVVLSGLSTGGKILLPVFRDEEQAKRQEESSKMRRQLMRKAREGNQSAIDTLTMEDMDTYSMLTRRVNVEKEDILSIVESSMMPYGVECEQYMAIGEIRGCYIQLNSLTQEEVWILSLDCAGLQVDVAINEKDLYGEPEIGRRFRGRIFLQGYIRMGRGR